METSNRRTKCTNPRATANPFSALAYWWMLDIFRKGYKRELEENDLYEPLEDHKSNYLGNKIEELWIAEKRSKKCQPRLLKILLKFFGPSLLFYGILGALSEFGARIARPFFLGCLIRYFSPGSGVTKQEAYIYAGGIVLCSLINILTFHPFFMGVSHLGMKMRVACNSLIYRKALRLSKASLGKITAGQIVNLLSNDVARFDGAFMFVHYFWIGPLEAAIAGYLMWQKMQESAILGLVIIFLFIPIQGYLGKIIAKYRLSTANKTDIRIRTMNEIICGIQVIKMYVWEKPFEKLIDMERRHEISQIKILSYIRGITLSFGMFTTRAAMLLSIVIYIYTGHKITADGVFVVLSYYNTLKLTLTEFLPMGISMVAETLISVQRIQKFLLQKELNETDKWNIYSEGGNARNCQVASLTRSKGIEENSRKIPCDVPVKLKSSTFKWNLGSTDIALSEINLTVKAGELVAIIGPVGSGKSSLLHAILGELYLESGSLTVSGKLTYACQESWILNDSVQKNITFGQTYEQNRYIRVVNACALNKDFEQLPQGDKTVVGERGVKLSGGQKARVNLARALYRDADIYLLDDPLSAVDTHVGKHLYNECIKGYLGNKTRILVTHHLHYLKHVDKIVILKNGKIQAIGSYSDLKRSGSEFSLLLESCEAEHGAPEVLKDQIDGNQVMEGTGSELNNVQIPKEVRSYGKLSKQLYKFYFMAGGNCASAAAMMTLFVLAQLLASCSDYWLTLWVNSEEKNYGSDVNRINITDNSPKTNEAYLIHTTQYVSIYSALIVALVIVTLSRSLFFIFLCMRASVKLHNKMFRAVMRASMYFFNSNASGRTLNRFSKDLGSIDELLPQSMLDTLQIGFGLLAIVVVVSVVNVWLLLPTTIIATMLYFIRRFFLTTSCSIKRLEGVTRSPIYSHVNASLHGLTTIRAFEAQSILEQEFDSYQDNHSSAWYLYITSSRAFGLWLDIICLVYISLVTFSFLVLKEDITGGDVGLAITQSIILTGTLQWGMRQSSEMENQMTSVERVKDYIDLESETGLDSKHENKPTETWPENGKIEFKNVYMRYCKMTSPVLKNLNFVIMPREKIGVVGRTGAGKSSLINALFCLAEVEGSITIDGIKTETMCPYDLRSKISIIPQDPVLFSGTVRRNLDPFDEYEDGILWKAIEEVEMKKSIADLADGLNSEVSEGGNNFSVGQRQLLCLARAIVRNNRILVLDEATANVDTETDTLIQKTIRQKFQSCTVITIAHRLHTVIDSDKILVLEEGEVLEYDHPNKLLQNTNGVFYKMVENLGAGVMNTLYKLSESNIDECGDTHL